LGTVRDRIPAGVLTRKMMPRGSALVQQLEQAGFAARRPTGGKGPVLAGIVRHLARIVLYIATIKFHFDLNNDCPAG